jgi:hypothetical protein
MQGITALQGVAVERAYWIAAPVVPIAEASLLVPSSGGGRDPRHQREKRRQLHHATAADHRVDHAGAECGGSQCQP